LKQNHNIEPEVKEKMATQSEKGTAFRISVGSALSRAAYGAFLRGAREMKEHGTFNFANGAVPFRELMRMFP
jgi:hypothetical protein